MAYEVEVTDEWLAWFDDLTADEQEELAASIGLLEVKGPHLPFPYSSGVASSRHSHMRELRTQVQGRPFRTLYAFDPRRVAILLIAGDKSAMIVGMRFTFLRRTISTMNTSRLSRRRV
jgi:hypothetical protein